MSFMAEKIAEMEASVANAQLQATTSQSQASAVRGLFLHSLPQLCRVECQNDGVPDAACEKCQCVPGYTGKWCHIPERCATKCPLETKDCFCRRGAKLNAECTCDCPPGWFGRRCATQLSGVPLIEKIKYLELLFNRTQGAHELSQAQNRKRAALGGTMLPNSIGSGVDSVSRALKAPVIQLHMGSQRVVSPYSGNSYLVPERTTYSAPSDSNARMLAETFNSVSDYVAWLRTARQSTLAPPGILVKSIDNVRDLFASYQQSFVSITQVGVPMFSLAMTSSNVAADYSLEANCAAAVDYLPADYSTEEARVLYRTFLDYWGDSFVESAMHGGVIESVHAVHKSICNSIPDSTHRMNFLTERQKKFMSDYFGPNGLIFAGTFEATGMYESSAAADSCGCAGGDPNRCVDLLRTRQDLSSWKASLFDLPTVMAMHLRPISDLIRDPNKRAAMQKAVEERSASLMSAYTSFGRDVNVCPETYPFPTNWQSTFGNLHCYQGGSKCWSKNGAFYDVCVPKLVNDDAMRTDCQRMGKYSRCKEIIRCRTPEGRTVDFLKHYGRYWVTWHPWCDNDWWKC